MGKLFVVIRRKGSKRFLGSVPVRKGATKANVKRLLRVGFKRGFIGKIVNSAQLKKIAVLQRPKGRKRK